MNFWTGRNILISVGRDVLIFWSNIKSVNYIIVRLSKNESNKYKIKFVFEKIVFLLSCNSPQVCLSLANMSSLYRCVDYYLYVSVNIIVGIQVDFSFVPSVFIKLTRWKDTENTLIYWHFSDSIISLTYRQSHVMFSLRMYDKNIW